MSVIDPGVCQSAASEAASPKSCAAAFNAKDYQRSAPVCKEAAEHGDATSQNYLAKLYKDGTGIAKDVSKARYWWIKSSAQNNIDAEIEIAVIYAVGDGVQKDLAEAARWCMKAANQGSHHAQKWLGNMYSVGQGVEKDTTIAAMWLRKAADQGDAEAMDNLALLYEKGDGVPQDYGEAAKLRERVIAHLPLAGWVLSDTMG